MLRALYTLIIALLTPAALLRLWWKGRRTPGYRQRWRERLGDVPAPAPGSVWVHAVSVGETLAAVPLLREMLERDPQLHITLSTTTPTGAERARAAFADMPQRVCQVYAPYDLPFVLRRFLRRVQPRLCLVMETELWPNLLHICAQQRVPVWLINARLSKRSARGYARFGQLTRPMLQQLSGVCAQHRADAARLIRLGVPAERVQITGNIKSDIRISESTRAAGRTLRADLGVARPVLIAASTHAGEDEIVLDAFALLRAQHADAALILVPRHPERFDSVAALIRQRGFTLARRTGASADRQTQVLLGDTMGELLALYCASDVAFVGGSLLPIGGHNLLEPAAVPMPILQGPYTHNFRALTRAFRRHHAVRIIHDAAALAAAWHALLAEPERSHASARAADVLREQGGGLTRVLRALGH